MLRTLPLTLILSLSLVNAGLAQVQLERKSVENVQYTTAIDSRTHQILTIQGMPTDTKSEQNMVVKSVAGKRDASGVLKVNHKVESLQVHMKVPVLGEITFDSVNPDKATNSPLLPVFQASAKSSWTVVVGKDGRVEAVEGRDKAFAELDPTTADAVKGQFDPEYLKTAANLEVDRIPKKPIKNGDSWEQTETLKLDSAQSLTFKRKYTYAGTMAKDGQQFDRINVEAIDVKLEIDGKGLKLVKSNLKVADSKGMLLFDRTRGRVVSDNQKNQIKGDLTFEYNGMELAGNLDLTMEISAAERP